MRPAGVALWSESSRFRIHTVLNGNPTGGHDLRAIIAAAILRPDVAVRLSTASRGVRPFQPITDLVARVELSDQGSNP